MIPSGSKILMVDEEPRNLRVLEGILAPLQFDLRRARRGAEALAQLAADPPDLVLLDVMMRGLSGFDVCREIKSKPETRFLPVVLVTALADRDSRVTGLGCDAYLSKPIEIRKVLETVRSVPARPRVAALHVAW